MSFQRKLESTTSGEKIPINREIEFGMTKVDRLRFFTPLRYVQNDNRYRNCFKSHEVFEAIFQVVT